MKTSDFTFELPENLIAQHPAAERGQSRLLVMDRKKGSLEHRMVRDLASIIESGTLVVFNNTRVRKARLFGVSEAGGAKVEFLLLEKVHENENVWRVMVQRARRRRPGSRYLFGAGVGAGLAAGLAGEIIAEEGSGQSPAGQGADERGAARQGGQSTAGQGEKGAEFRLLRFDRPIDDAWLDIHGHVPLPPYIRRQDSGEDGERYQTVYAREYGSAAAPTAGLHFTKELLGELEGAGIESAFITLHVGPGTFLPVRTENIEDHTMHGESYSISDECAGRIEKAKREGRKILAVGTTSVRTLESAVLSAGETDVKIQRGKGSTSIFMYPGYQFKVVDSLFTNFHTPGSTLLMLVSAFAGRDFILKSYGEAVSKGYRFYSYGDACLIL